MAAIAGVPVLALLLPLQVPGPPTFAVGVENVNVDVLVTRGGRTVEGLGARDFVLTDNGVPQQVEVVAQSSTAIDAVLALDVSSSVRGTNLSALRKAAHAFVDALCPSDSVTLVAFATELRVVSSAGEPRATVHTAIDGLEGAGATALVDAAYAALLLTDPRRGRPLVVVFSDGVDRGSWLDPETVLATASVEDAVVHYVDVEGALTFLEPLADATGGRGWSARRWDKLPGVFVEALDEFKSRYRLRYEPAGVALEGWHKIDVRLAGKKGAVRARPGYLVPGPSGAR
ncbi:MAG TPA: VWA domain-containing protein [Vicinamibacteria bacterium]|nr:VWA domain-containing protein [Vicinamibacteria bacterium]